MIVDTTASRYLAASTVYLIYTLVIMCIDIGGYGGFYGPLYDSVFMTLGYTTKTVNLTESIVANPIVQNDYYLESSASSAAENAYWSHYYDQAALALVPLYTGEATSGRWSPERVNSLFVFAALLHFLNAWQYAYAWYNRRWNDVVLYPEIMNILGSWLYLITATWYPLADELIAAPNFEYTNPLVMRLHYVETAAASWELFAAFGWTYTYWKTFRRAPGRGCTLDDPDLHGSLMIVIPSFIYLGELRVCCRVGAYHQHVSSSLYPPPLAPVPLQPTTSRSCSTLRLTARTLSTWWAMPRTWQAPSLTGSVPSATSAAYGGSPALAASPTNARAFPPGAAWRATGRPCLRTRRRCSRKWTTGMLPRMTRPGVRSAWSRRRKTSRRLAAQQAPPRPQRPPRPPRL